MPTNFILFSDQIINAAAHRNREEVLQKSREMKFLTGYESKVVLLSETTFYWPLMATSMYYNVQTNIILFKFIWKAKWILLTVKFAIVPCQMFSNDSKYSLMSNCCVLI